jgi:hypothetical protein
MNTARFATLILVSFSLSACAAALPQQVSPIEVGGASTTLFGNRANTANDTGLTGRFTYNFTPSFSIDSEFGGYPTNGSPSLVTSDYGGTPFLALIGPKVGFRTRHVDVFLKIRPGVLSYSSAFALVPTIPTPLVRKTDAVLDVGAVFEFRTSARTFIRVDIGKLLVREGGGFLPEVTSGPLEFALSAPGYLDSPLHLEVGFGYRAGSLRPTTESEPLPSRFTFGPQYSLLTLVRSKFTLRDESGIGGFFTWDFSKYVGLDSSVLVFPRKVEFVDFQQGGRMVQAVAGIRAGVRRGRFGVYGKVRPGIQLFTFTSSNIFTEIENGTGYTPYTDLAFDVGGIIEYSASRHVMLRLDGGQTLLYFRARNLINQTNMPYRALAFSENAAQVSLGVGFRFGFPHTNASAQ